MVFTRGQGLTYGDALMHASIGKAHCCLYAVTTDDTDACLRRVFPDRRFQRQG